MRSGTPDRTMLGGLSVKTGSVIRWRRWPALVPETPFREMRGLRIYGGASDVQKFLIARCGLARG
jgi:alkylation response protein AidB-like acyl-CoA dehydrogenase